MLRDLELRLDVVVPKKVPTKDMETGGLIHRSLIITRLLIQLSKTKATEQIGYFMSITNLKKIDKGQSDETSSLIIFPVTFVCRTFLPVRGEIMHGVVQRVRNSGVFLKSGPMNCVYLSSLKMLNYHYVSGKKPMFCNDGLSRIEKGVVVLFKVLAVRWSSIDNLREFMVLATLEGDDLGPISSAGYDGMEF